MTRLEIRTLARKKLGETTAAFWSDTEMNTYINLGCSDVAERTLCLRTTGHLTTSEVVQNAGATVESQWALSSSFTNFLSVLDCHFHQNGTNWEEMEHKYKKDLDVETPGWRDAVGRPVTDPSTLYNYQARSGVPYQYWWDYEEDLIGIYPPSNSANATSNNLKILYAFDSAGMSEDSESPDIQRPLHLAIVEFVTATGHETRGLQDKANNSWAKYFKMLDDYHINKLKGREDDDVSTKPYRSVS